MKRYSAGMAAGIALAVIFQFSCNKADRPGEAAASEKRESIHDRVIHFEKEILTEVPQAGRWCDRLKLIKRRINIGDCELYVEEEGKGMPLVLINGGPGGTHHYFHPWFGRAAKFSRVIYYDQRGCGLSDYLPGKNGYSVEQAVEDLDAVRRALRIDKWIVLGYSYGGFLAQYYATKHPGKMAGLILLGASPGMWIEMKDTRQYDFISREERDRLREIEAELQKISTGKDWSDEKYLALLIYNNFINGDWKRQNYYRPSPERMAQGCLYEWNYDMKNSFRNGISNSQDKIDLSGAFGNFPVPTLILEGRWDLTWNTDKPEILHKNHPGSRLVMVEDAGHGIYDENPDVFFNTLKEFVKKLPKVKPEDVESYKTYLADWDREQKTSEFHIIKGSGWDRASMANLAAAYQRGWCDRVDNPSLFLKMGFALYEAGSYDEALYVFEKMQPAAENKQNENYKIVAMIWQGHMLDLAGKRKEALARYKKVADMNNTSEMSHDQYGLQYSFSPYARERLKTPFLRVENQMKD